MKKEEEKKKKKKKKKNAVTLARFQENGQELN